MAHAYEESAWGPQGGNGQQTMRRGCHAKDVFRC